MSLLIVNAYIIFIQRSKSQNLTLKKIKIAISNELKILVLIEKRISEAAHMPIHGTKVKFTNVVQRLIPIALVDK